MTWKPLIFGLVVVGVLLAATNWLCEYYWDGQYDLTVTIASHERLPKWVLCLPWSAREGAEHHLSRFLNADKHGMEINGTSNFLADPFDGQPINVPIMLDAHGYLLT